MSKDNDMLAELKKIRELLTPAPPPPPPKGLINEFKAFLDKYKIVGLAVAFIMGIYAGAVIQALVSDLIMPIVQFFLPAGMDWEVIAAGPFRVGHFIGALITFIIVALVIFLLIKISSKMKASKKNRIKIEKRNKKIRLDLIFF